MDSRFDLQDILGSLEQQQIHPTLDQANGLLPKNIGQLIIRDIREIRIVRRGEHAGGAHRPGDKSRLGRTFELIGSQAGKPGSRPVNLQSLILQSIFLQGQAVSAK